MSVGFRPTEADSEMIESLKRPGEKTSDVLRRALRALADAEWQDQARADMERIAAEGDNIHDEPDAWGYDEHGNVVDYAPDAPGKSPARQEKEAYDCVLDAPLGRVMSRWEISHETRTLRGVALSLHGDELTRRALADLRAAHVARGGSSNRLLGRAARAAAVYQSLTSLEPGRLPTPTQRKAEAPSE
ncbi:hypothetical protein [Streptomyces sp. gCLA4]|uniref:hypothetical protein n=1 Tax=Streptomyces sp. gCLA4 TaxID=1873416 RepID=UPI001C7E74BC|nr:hypothetical protein [Streptomyces sp. gCLA4]